MASTNDLVVGNVTAIEVRHNSPLLPSLFPDEPTSKTYTGEVLPSLPVDDVDTIRLSSSDPEVPVRVIYLRTIISIGGAPFNFKPTQASKKQVEKTVVKVQGSKGTTYELTVFPDGLTKCSCSGFGFRGKCRHVDAYLAAN